MKFCYNTNFTLPEQSQRSRSILQDGSRSLRLFWKKKIHLIIEEIWYQDLSLTRIDQLTKVRSKFYLFHFISLNVGPTISQYLLLYFALPAAGSFPASLRHDLFRKLILSTSCHRTSNYWRVQSTYKELSQNSTGYLKS